jgi:ACS family hexuronate transporter-like MFS transporter
MLFLATTINYVDRMALAVVSVDVRREFGLSEQDYSHILTLFMAAYAIMYAGSGYIVDRLGTKKGFALFIGGWSIMQILHAFSIGKWSLAAFRFGLGLTEPGNWPAAAKAVAEWFPARQRRLDHVRARVARGLRHNRQPGAGLAVFLADPVRSPALQPLAEAGGDA